MVHHFAVCWNSLRAPASRPAGHSFGSEKMPGIGQSAGNLFSALPYGRRLFSTPKDSSETRRETSLVDFTDYWREAAALELPRPPLQFLQWFIGFSEGDGSWIVSGQRCFFFLVQADRRVLLRLRSTLGFGTVAAHGRYYRFSVTRLPHLRLLVILFRGRLVLAKVRQRFAAFARALGVTSGDFPVALPTLQDGWLAGFIDAEGCFSIALSRDGRRALGWRLRPRFMLYQNESEVLDHCRRLLDSGRVRQRSAGQDYTLTLDSHRPLGRLLAYLAAFPLRGAKQLDLDRWRRIWRALDQGHHRDPRHFRRLLALSRRPFKSSPRMKI